MRDDYRCIETAIRFIRGNVTHQPSLDEVASHVGLSPFHFQRLFRRWAGTTPKRFLDFLTVGHAKALLNSPRSILDVTYDLGLTSPSRLHDHFVAIEAVSPGEYKKRGHGVEIAYGVHASPFGTMFLAQSPRGVCMLSFLDDESDANALQTLELTWPEASLREDSRRTLPTAQCIFDDDQRRGEKVHLAVRGTNFQVNVWRALLRIPSGSAVTYQELARSIGKPKSARAIARAVAANPVAFLIPCHRVLRSTGELGGYRWGTERKELMVARESAQAEPREATVGIAAQSDSEGFQELWET